MPWGDLGAHVAATGLVLAATVGSGFGLARGLGRPTPRLGGALLAAGAMAAIAAPDLAFPFSPVPRSERNLMVAVVALGAAAWVGRRLAAPAPPADTGQLMLFGQLAFWLAVALAAVAPGSLRPQAVGSIVLGAEAPVKLACGALALLALPVVSGAVEDRLEPAREPVSAALGFPFAALLISEFLPPPGDDLPGLMRWMGSVALLLVLLVVAARMLGRDGAATLRAYRRLVPALAVLAVAVTALVVLL